MTWNLNTLFAFYKNQSNPAEAVRLATAADPCGRMVAAFLQATQTFVECRDEHNAIALGTFSIDPDRAIELETSIATALGVRAAMLIGLESAVLVVADYPEPTKRYFESLIVGMKRGRGTQQDIDAVQGIIDSLENIAIDAFS